MDEKIQQPVIANWHKVTTENLTDLADLEGYESITRQATADICPPSERDGLGQYANHTGRP